MSNNIPIATQNPAMRVRDRSSSHHNAIITG